MENEIFDYVLPIAGGAVILGAVIAAWRGQKWLSEITRHQWP